MKKILIASLGLMMALFAVVAQAHAANSTISDFESGTLEDWNNGTIVSGFNSADAMQLSNAAFDGVESKKYINNNILDGYTSLEFDVNINGQTLLENDAGAIIIDQGGWKIAQIKNYLNNGATGWQHVVIPLSDFSDLDINTGIASLGIRIWNMASGTYQFDNFSLSNNSMPPLVNPPSTPNGTIIANFNSGLNGFNGGDASSGYLRLTNPSNGDATVKKVINSNILVNHTQLAFDINLNGASLLPGDAAEITIDQGGTISVPLKSLVVNGVSGWQHVVIPLSSFPGLNPNTGIASIGFRFWNFSSTTIDIDNISQDESSAPPPPAVTIVNPSNLSSSITDNIVTLTWTGSGPTYKIYRNSAEIGQVNSPSFIDPNVLPGQTYSYYVLATNGTNNSNPSNTIAVFVPPIAVPDQPPSNTWSAKSIDSQVASRYWGLSDPNQIRALVQADKSLGAKQIAVGINYDNYDLLKLWADIIHLEGLNVWYRGTWNDWATWQTQGFGISNQEYLNRTKQFIINHPELFKEGDAFTMAAESENAAMLTGINSGPFNGWNDWLTFTRNQVVYANDAFSQIGLGGKVKTNWINMNGWVAWNILDQNTVNTLGQLTLDHIIDWTDDINTYRTSLFQGNPGNGFIGYDQYRSKFNVPVMAGEWGYSTFNQYVDPAHQKAMAEAILTEFKARSWITGINYWVDAGHASRLFDNSDNLLTYARRPVADTIQQYFA
ncbi:MAG TPA: hypothetical protein PK263_04445 [bacterium]|nr:hypothetical protein [bacterium]